MPLVGKYCNGDPFAISPVQITSITPACEEVTMTNIRTGEEELVLRNGAMRNHGEGVPGHGPTTQGYYRMTTQGNVSAPYSSARNIDPGAIGVPILFQAGEEGSITKATMRSSMAPGNAGRPVTQATAILTVAAVAPPAGAFRPGLAAPSKVSHWVEDDMDLDLLPAHPLVPGGPTPFSALRRIRYKQQVEATAEPGGERFRSIYNTPYGPYNARGPARAIAEAVTLLCMDIPAPDKRNLAVALCQIGIDVLARAQQGGEWGTTQNGTGGVAQTGNKLALLTAGVLFGNPEMLDYGSGARDPLLFGEDVQIIYVNEAMIGTGVRYLPGDLGMPEWAQNPRKAPHLSARVRDEKLGNADNHDEAYRAINTQWQIQAAMAYHMWPTLKVAHGNPAFFDYCDRMMERTRFFDGGPVGWARSEEMYLPGLSAEKKGNSSRPTQWALNCWDTYRISLGGPIWNWM